MYKKIFVKPCKNFFNNLKNINEDQLKIFNFGFGKNQKFGFCRK